MTIGKRNKMNDAQIIDLYWWREETAILETSKKYGNFCHQIAKNILSTDADAEECVNDTYLQVWNTIPPQRPDKFRAYLGKIVRNLAINLWNKNHRKKRYAGIDLLLSELEDCLPSPKTVEHEMEEKELTIFLNTWLAALPRDDRILFIRRYWNGEAINKLAEDFGITATKMAKCMYRLRQNLKASLEKEGYWI